MTGPKLAKSSPDPGENPLVSIIMANHCGAAYLRQTIASVQAQTLRKWELLVCDDASADDSVAIVQAAALRDPRIRLLASSVNTGPSGARNRGLEAARGDWIAIVDSDDLMHPRRLETLVAAAQDYAVDLVADDMVFFGATPDVAGRTLLQSLELSAPILVDADILLASDDPATGLPALGYLKPLIRRSAVAALRYDPTLTIGEDFDLLLRLLLRRGWLLVLPEGFYLYRRHPKSLSYRQSGAALSALLGAQRRLAADLRPEEARALAPRLARRQRALETGLRFEALVATLKDRRARVALRQMAGDPALARRLWRSLTERFQRRFSRRGSSHKTPLTLILAEAGVDPAPGLVPPRGALRLDVPPPRLPNTRFAEPPAALLARLSHLAARHRLTVLACGAAGIEAAGYLPDGVEVRRIATETPRPARVENADQAAPLNGEFTVSA